ncbi:MAG: hypothetical protein LBE56_12465 [Tannerella sp.]|jgi:uncharacterized protein YcbK (DUF882 family)|nr:hypothetical protein [Tannerella sp.]
MITANFFKESEFQRCVPACSLQDMDQELMNRLDLLREKAGIPLVLNSAYRSVAHEKKMGRAGTSAHTLRVAVDIRCGTDANRFKIVKAAIELGFARIGIAKTYLHLDISTRHTQEVVWLY